MVYETISLIFAAISERTFPGVIGCLPESGKLVNRREFRAVLAGLDALPPDRDFSLVFGNVSSVAAPFLLWNLKRRGFSGCRASRSGRGVMLELKR